MYHHRGSLTVELDPSLGLHPHACSWTWNAIEASSRPAMATDCSKERRLTHASATGDDPQSSLAPSGGEGSRRRVAGGAGDSGASGAGSRKGITQVVGGDRAGCGRRGRLQDRLMLRLMQKDGAKLLTF